MTKFTESLNKAAEKYRNQTGSNSSTELEKEISKLGFEDGAKWAVQQLYTEGEVFDLLIKLKKDCMLRFDGDITGMSLLEWFNKNKEVV